MNTPHRTPPRSIGRSFAFACVAALGLVLLPSAGAQAAVIVSYHDGTTSIAPIGPVGYVTAGNETFTGESWRTSWGGAGNTPAGPTAGTASGSQWRMFRAISTPGTPSSTTQYIGFTLTYTGDQKLELSTLSFDWATAASGAGGGITLAWTAFASVNGGAFTAIDSAPLMEGLGGAAPASAFSPVTTAVADLSPLALLANGDTVAFRIGIADNSGSNSKANFVQGIRLTGFQVPAPAALPAGLALIGLVAARRPRRRGD